MTSGNHSSGKGSRKVKNFLYNSRPDLLKLISNDLNPNIDPMKLSTGSHKIIIWKTQNCLHFFKQTVYGRCRQNLDCPFCQGKTLLSGFNDLATTHPHLISEWNDKTVDPKYVLAGSHKKVEWLGKCGHKWKAAIYSRAYKGNGCGICSNRVKIMGINDFSSRYPDLISTWSLHNNIKPTEVYFYSEEKYWWTCSFCKKDWLAKISSRAGGWNNCPNCFSKSRLESHVALYLQSKNHNYVQNSRPIKLNSNGKKNLQLDFILPEYMIAFEVQDFATHSKESDCELQDSWFGGGYKQGPTKHAFRKKLAFDQLNLTLFEIWQDEIENGEFKNKINKILEDSLMLDFKKH